MDFDDIQQREINAMLRRRIERDAAKALARKSRIRGALIGLAVGDALGTTLEFAKPGTFQTITDMTGGGWWQLQPGQFTDDTSMALCLAESLLQRDGFDANDQMQRYAKWWQEGYLSSTGECFDIGTTTKDSLQRYIDNGNPFAGSTDRFTAANGSLMRLAPIAMFYANDAKLCIEMAAQSSRTTHAALGSGYAAESLEAALWAFARSDNFRDGCLLAANLGNDADTTAAIFGQLAGACYGEEGIPEEWRSKLALRDTIEQLAERLHEKAAAR